MDQTSVDRIKMRAQADQQSAALTDHAMQLAQYRAALVNEGFSRSEAMALVRDYQTSLLAKIFGQKQNGD